MAAPVPQSDRATPAAPGAAPAAALPPVKRLIEAVAPHVPGWLLLVSGLAMVAAAAVTPATLELRELNWRLELMRQQEQALAQQREAYDLFVGALEQDDPVLLERLAFVNLRLKPAGVEPACPTTASVSAAAEAAVEDWLHVDLPQEGVDYAPLPEVKSRLVRLSTGTSRLILAAAGFAFALAGVASTPGNPYAHLRPELRPPA